MNSVFITGISCVGKSTMAKKLATELGVHWMNMDDLKGEMEQDTKLKPWVNMFWNKDEAEYYQTTTREKQWQDIVDQSEAFWDTAKQHIQEEMGKGETCIFEGVNLLPHLMHQLGMKGVVLLAESEEQIFKRLQESPRWSEKEELQRVEAKAFFENENVHYAMEAEKFGYSLFSDPELAEAELLRLIGKE